MSVSRLRVTGFRCYESAHLDLDARSVVLTGPNGAGKTNLLEAVSLLAPGRGLRGARLEEMDRRDGANETDARTDSEGWAIAAAVNTAAGPIDIGTGHRPDAANRRIVRIDGKPSRSQTSLAEYVSAVWLTPQMDRLFTDGASGRRRFLDRMVFGFDAAHAGRVSGYEHTMRQRAKLLREGTSDTVWLDTLESDMAERGVAIAAARRELTARLANICATPIGPFPGADLAVSGSVEAWLDNGPALAAEDNLKNALRDSRAQDAAAGGAAVGPHRSDFEVRHLGHGMPAALCSTGEQKALLIAIVLANARLQTAERGRVPLLLLDEVAAHLDAGRRQALFEEITGLGAQAWYTGTDRAVFEPLGAHAQHVSIRAGTLEYEPGGKTIPASDMRRESV